MTSLLANKSESIMKFCSQFYPFTIISNLAIKFIALAEIVLPLMVSQKVFRCRNTSLIAILGSHHLQNSSTITLRFYDGPIKQIRKHSLSLSAAAESISSV